MFFWIIFDRFTPKNPIILVKIKYVSTEIINQVAGSNVMRLSFNVV